MTKMSRFALAAVGAVFLAAPGSAQQTVVVPSGSPAVTMVSEPFGKGPGRFQQVYSGQDFGGIGAATFKALAFKPHASAQATAHKVDLELFLGYSAKAPALMSTTFAQNYLSPPSTIVSRRQWNLPALPGGGGFTVRFPFDQPFQWNGTGDLLLEAVVWNNDNGNNPFYYDLELAFSSRITYVSTYTSPLASTGIRQLGQGLKTQFDYSQATFTPYGKGCPGEGSYVPAIANVGLPRVATVFQVYLNNITGSRNVWLFTGRSGTAWGPLALPFDLAGVGAPGCNLLTDVVFITGTLSQGGLAGTGYAYVGQAIPAFTGFVGAVLHYQWMVYAPGANPLGVALSDAAQARIDL